MKATEILIVRVARDFNDEFYSIKAKDAISLLDFPCDERWAYFIRVAKDAKVHSTSEENLYIDASGNQTDREFWESDEGEKAWAEELGQEYIATVNVDLIDDATAKQAGIPSDELGEHQYDVVATSDFKAGEYALDLFHDHVPIRKLDLVEVEVSAKRKYTRDH